MADLRIWIQRASEDNYSFITTKDIQVMSQEKLMEFLLNGLKAGDKFILKPGNQEDIDISIYYYDFLT